MLQEMAKGGMKVPALEKRPQLSKWLLWAKNQYDELSLDRRIGPEGTPLSLTTGEIAFYFKVFRLRDTVTFEGFYDLMRALDSAWLTQYFEQRRRAKQKA